jgi:hypothetical protein
VCGLKRRCLGIDGRADLAAAEVDVDLESKSERIRSRSDVRLMLRSALILMNDMVRVRKSVELPGGGFDESSCTL